MIELRLQIDDDPSWAAFTKEAVAERLSELGPVRVVEVKVDKHRSASISGPRRMEGSDGEKPKAARPPVLSRRRTEAAGRRPLNASVTDQQMGMFTPPTSGQTEGYRDVCPKCGRRVLWVRGPEGERVMRDVAPRAFWPDIRGQKWFLTMAGAWELGCLEGSVTMEHTVGYPIHQCKEG